MAVDILYTGRNLTPEFKSDGGKAMSRLSDFITRAEEIKYKAFKDNENWLLQTENVDPVVFATAAGQKAQSDGMDTFNEIVGGVLKEAGGIGNLSHDAKSKIQLAKNVLLGEQQKILSAQTRAFADKEAISKDIRGEYDYDNWKERWDTYLTTGEYDETPLEVSALDPDAWYSTSANKVKGTPSNEPTERNVGGTDFVEWTKTSATPEEGAAKVEADAGMNRRLAKGFLLKFQGLKKTDPETYKKYLDVNKDNVVDSNEERAATQAKSNPILQWAKDTYGPKAVGIDTTKPTRKYVPATSTDGFNSKLPIGPDNNKNNQYPVRTGRNAPTRRYGTIKDADWIQLGHIPQQRGEPLLIDEIVDYSSGSPVRKTTKTITDTETGDKTEKPISTQVRFNIIAYLPKDDVILVEIDDDVRPFSKGEKVPLPADKYDEILKSKPLNYYRGTVTKEEPSIDRWEKNKRK